MTGPGVSIAFAYDPAGNLISAKREEREEKFSYYTEAPQIFQRADDQRH
ncbi:hypothetical protein LP419_39355 [Massilia sp. H-1]|nr:hypothetical protein LP419_39355 [Massilia sp. H-1]